MKPKALLIQISLFLIYLFSSPPAKASECSPTLLYQKKGVAAGDHLGNSIAGVGDVNGDGIPDFIAGAPGADSAGADLVWAGSVYVYSGADGSLLYQRDGGYGPTIGLTAGDGVGVSVAGIGDVNADGKTDFLVGASVANPGGLIDAGSAYVYSGADGSLIYQVNGLAGDSPDNLYGDRLGYKVSGAGDVNGDSVPDFIVGASRANPNGINNARSAYVYSGADGSLLYQMNGADSNIIFGLAVAGLGDVDNDGKADFIIGAPASEGIPLNLNHPGSVYVYSGGTGALLYSLNGPAIGDGFGFSVSGIGDLNKDGKSDFIVGALTADAFVYSGSDGTLLYRLNGGWSVAGAGDVNGDGTNDFVIGSTDYSPNGAVFVYSGATGSLLYQINGFPGDHTMGSSVAGEGDLNGDGRADILVGAGRADSNAVWDFGAVYVFLSGFPRGDLNLDARLTPTDVALALMALFLNSSFPAPSCAADTNCDGILTLTDIAIELNAVFLNEPLCSL